MQYSGTFITILKVFSNNKVVRFLIILRMENFRQILATFYTHFKHYSEAIVVLIVFKHKI